MDRYFEITRKLSDLIILNDMYDEYSPDFIRDFMKYCKMNDVTKREFRSCPAWMKENNITVPMNTRHVYYGIKKRK